MYDPKVRYPEDDEDSCGSIYHNIELAHQFHLVLSADPASPLYHYKFNFSLDFRFKDINLPLKSIYQIQRFQYYLESFSQNLMIKNKVYFEDDILYCHSFEEDIDSFHITFKLESNEITLISLDKAQAYILAKELPRAIEQTIELYTASLKEQIAHHNHSIIQIGPLNWH